MNDQERKARLIVVLVLVNASLILIELLLMCFHLGPTILNLIFWLTEFIVSVVGLIAVRGWLAQRWIRLCAVAIFLAVICWTIFWPVAAAIIIPAAIST